MPRADETVPAVATDTAKAAVAFLLVAVVIFFVRRAEQDRLPDRAAEEVHAPWTTAEARRTKRAHTVNTVINGNLDLAATPSNDRRWQEFLGAVKWQADRRPEVLAAVRRRLAAPAPAGRSGKQAVETQRLLLETAYGLFPTELEPEMRHIFLTDPDAKRTAMAGAWLLRFRPDEGHRSSLAEALRNRWPDCENEPRLLAFLNEAAQPREKVISSRPPLADLLRAPFDGQPVIFSLQRVDRRWTGRAVVRNPSGQFLLGPDGAPFSVPQFALSASGLPGTLTNGNTPCGIFEVRRIGTTRNTAIGPSETLILGLPLEYDRTWTEARYEGLLPPAWRGWWPAREAWWAGQAGRNEILAHGTAIDPAPWQDTVFAGLTPSHGCLTCDESWDPATGRRVMSGQVELTAAFRKAGGAPGYLVVVELDDRAAPVTAGEVAALVESLP